MHSNNFHTISNSNHLLYVYSKLRAWEVNEGPRADGGAVMRCRKKKGIEGDRPAGETQ